MEQMGEPPKEHRRSNLSSSRHLLETCLLSTIMFPHLKMGVMAALTSQGSWGDRKSPRTVPDAEEALNYASYRVHCYYPL